MSKVKLTKAEMEALIRDRGFELTSRTGDGFTASYVKRVRDELSEQEAVIHCTVQFNIGQCILISVHGGGFELKSGWFQIDHPRYQQWFEDKIAAMTMTLNEVYG